MSLLGRDNFARDLMVLLLVGIVLASLFSLGLAATTDRYFARAVTGVLGDYGQYDLLFQVRSELRDATIQQLSRIVAERFPGSRLHSGLTIANKSTIFMSLAKPYRTREVFEGLYYHFGNLPGNAGFSIIAEPRIVVSSVPGGAQELLSKEFSRLPGMAFTFRDGDNLNLVLDSARELEEVRKQVKGVLARYRLLEVRFPINSPISDVGTLGQQLETAARRVPGVQLAKDVTRGGSTSDSQYMGAALSELRRFMVSYAAHVTVQPVGETPLIPGDRLVLQGRAPRLPVPGRAKDSRFVEVKLERVINGVGEGLIIQGDASYVKNVSAFKLLPGEKVGDYVGTVTVTDERTVLGKALDEGAKLLQQVQTIAADPSWDASGSLRSYQGVLGQMGEVQRLLTSVRDGLGVATSAETRARLHQVSEQIDGISDDLEYLANTMARVKLVEDRVSTVLDQVGSFQLLFRGAAARGGLPQKTGELGQGLLSAEQGLTGAGEYLRRKARQVDDFINRFNPFVQVLLGWGERAHVLATQLDYFGGVMEPGSKARKTLDSLLNATDSTLNRLHGFDSLSLLEEMSRGQGHLSSLGQLDLATIIDQMQFLRNSLPKLLDEEIGRSVGLIDRYLGGEVIPGERIQLMVNADADIAAVSTSVQRISGQGATNVLRLPAGVIEADFRGEVFRVLGEVRTTITALVLLAFFVLEFLLDQTAIVAMFRRRAEMVGRRVMGPRPGLAHLAAVIFNPARVYAIGFGALWLSASFILTGARLPLLGGWGATVLGGILGLLLGSLAERINPINGDEVMAGESLGLPFVLIMREIVIPAGRPGLLQILNRRRMQMK